MVDWKDLPHTRAYSGVPSGLKNTLTNAQAFAKLGTGPTKVSHVQPEHPSALRHKAPPSKRYDDHAAWSTYPFIARHISVCLAAA
jgi:hypothetical protein